MDLDVAGLGALAEQPQGALAGRQADVVDIEGDGLGDARAGVERGARQSAVAGRGAGVHGAQPAQGGALVQRAGGRIGEVDALGGGGSEPTASVEVIDGGQGIVDGGGLALGDGEQMGAVVAHGPVADAGVGERVAVDIGGL